MNLKHKATKVFSNIHTHCSFFFPKIKARELLAESLCLRHGYKVCFFLHFLLEGACYSIQYLTHARRLTSDNRGQFSFLKTNDGRGFLIYMAVKMANSASFVSFYL